MLRRVKKLLAATAAIMSVGAIILSGRLVRRYVVEGRSMLRAFAPGDRLLVERLSLRWRPLRISDAVVVRWPNALARPSGSPGLDLKRIAAAPGQTVTMVEGERVLGDDEWFVLGDNLDESTDSRQLGPVRTQDIVGRVWRKY